MSRLIPQSLPLVRVRDALQVIDEVDITVDPYLLLKHHTDLQVSPWMDKEATLGCLGHRILGQPTDLRAHVQRIFLLIKIGDGAALYSALLDLMIALGTHGQALKQRMLALAAPLLAPATRDFLQRHLDAGFVANNPEIARVRGALLRSASVQGQPLVRRLDGDATLITNNVEQANELLEYGQLEHAVELLEDALLQNPDLEAEAEMLSELYRSMRADARWQGLREQLQLNFGRVPKAWAA